jgi:hypothetical protein
MSFVHAGDDLLVLDQVNERVVRYDASGRVKASFPATGTTQDITVAKDGTVVLLDRLVDKTVRLVDPSGRALGALPLPADRVGDTGLVTGVFVDGSDIYVEKSHGVLVRIGTTAGSAAGEGELTGRPSKDGSLLLTVALVAREGRLNVSAFDRRLGTLRFARTIPFQRPTREVALVDTDDRGTIYVGVTSEALVAVACLDNTDGHVLGRVVLPSSVAPEESFRDFSVAGDGTILAAVRSEEGIAYRTARCP